MRVTLAALLLVAAAACGGGSESSDPGDPAVYADIEATTDCGELQTGFDRNMSDVERREPGDPLRDVTMAYAEAYDAQMKEAGCYD